MRTRPIPLDFHQLDSLLQGAEGHENDLVLGLDVARALAGAPSPVRAVALLASLAYNETEIAGLLGISRQKVWRLRQHLRRLLEPVLSASEGR